ncbi:hypothetical protein BESB_065520 [Besnoitia besnoiti]|uniref:Uncharacterized protein n=1 Tax=Besnoitia besnoiti TaxID=94643 RepID=A0A2A9MGH8_BESBE|nr:hypothetical protein BESB_065520 [Besnoitia besnoiti]PFH34520.1 hypothetical protein BESB_065520 [Besnoitia besnoiti]
MACPSPYRQGAVPPPSAGAERRPNTQRPIHRADPYASSLLGRLASKLASSVSSLFSSPADRKQTHASASPVSTVSSRLLSVPGAVPLPDPVARSVASSDGRIRGERTSEVTSAPSAGRRRSLFESLDPSLWPRDNASFLASSAAAVEPSLRQASLLRRALPGYASGAENQEAVSLSPCPLNSSLAASYAAPAFGSREGSRAHFRHDAAVNLEASRAQSVQQHQWHVQHQLGAWGPQPIVDGVVLTAPSASGRLQSGGGLDALAPAAPGVSAGYADHAQTAVHSLSALPPSVDAHARTRFAPGGLAEAGPIRRPSSETRAARAMAPPAPLLCLHPQRGTEGSGLLRQEEEHLTVDQLQRLYLRCQPLRWRVRLRELFRQESESPGSGLAAEDVHGAGGSLLEGTAAGRNAGAPEGSNRREGARAAVDGSSAAGREACGETARRWGGLAASGAESAEVLDRPRSMSRGAAAEDMESDCSAGTRPTGESREAAIVSKRDAMMSSSGPLQGKQSFLAERRGAAVEGARETSTVCGSPMGAANEASRQSHLPADSGSGDSASRSLFGSAAAGKAGLSPDAGKSASKDELSAKHASSAFSLPFVGGSASSSLPSLFGGAPAEDKSKTVQPLSGGGSSSSSLAGSSSGLSSGQTASSLFSGSSFGASSALPPGALFGGSSPPAASAPQEMRVGDRSNEHTGVSLFGAQNSHEKNKGDMKTAGQTRSDATYSKRGSTSLFGGGVSSSLSGPSSLFGNPQVDDSTIGKDTQSVPTFGKLMTSSAASDIPSATAGRGASLFGGSAFFCGSVSGADAKSSASTQPQGGEADDLRKESPLPKEGAAVSASGETGTAALSEASKDEKSQGTKDGKNADEPATQGEAAATVPWWQQNVGKACLVQVEDDGFAPDADDDPEEKESPAAAGSGLAPKHSFATPAAGGSLFGSAAAELKPPATTSSLFGTYSAASSTAAPSTTSSAGGSLFGGATTSNVFGTRMASTGTQGTGAQTQAAAGVPSSLFVFGGGGAGGSSTPGGNAGKQATGSSSGAAGAGSASGSLFGSSVFGASSTSGGISGSAGGGGATPAAGSLFVFGGGAASNTSGGASGDAAPETKKSGTGLFVFGSSSGASEAAGSISGGAAKRGRDGDNDGAPAAKSLFGGGSQTTSTTGSVFGASSAPSSLFGASAPAGGSGASISSSPFAFGASAGGAKEADKGADGTALGAPAGGSLFGERSSTPVFGATPSSTAGSGGSPPSAFGQPKTGGSTGNPFEFGKNALGNTSASAVSTGSLFGNSGGTASATGATSLFGTSLGTSGSGGTPGNLFGAATTGSSAGGTGTQRLGTITGSSPFGSGGPVASQNIANGEAFSGVSLFGGGTTSRPFAFGDSQGVGAQGQSGEDGNPLFGPQAGGPVVRRPRLTIKRTKK